MPKNTEKIKATKIREDMARKYGVKLKEKDARIQQLLSQLLDRDGQIKRLERELEQARAAMSAQDKLVQELRGMAGMQPEDLEKLRRDMENRDRIRQAVLPMIKHGKYMP